MSMVYLNGQFIQDVDARLSPFDRGFLFGDALYDVLPVYKGHVIAFDEHVKRLWHSLETMKIPMPCSVEKLREILQQLIQYQNIDHTENTADDLTLYIQISRGVEIPRSHIPGKNLTPSLFITCYPSVKISEAKRTQGVSAITVLDTRRYDCHIKSTALLPNTTALAEAYNTGAQEAIFMRDNIALEGTGSNLFVVVDNVLRTPPLQPHIVAGITRDIVLKLAQNNNIPTAEAAIPFTLLQVASEIWLTGSIKEIYPVVQLNGKKVGTGAPGPYWKKMHALYQHYKEHATYTLPD